LKEGKIMRSVYVFTLGAVLGLLLSFVLAGCGGSHSKHGPYVNKYLTACYADADGVVFVDINLPEAHYGLLTETSSPQLGQIAVESATYNLGVFEPGTYTFQLELILRDVQLPPRPRLGPGVKNLDGFIETCELVVEGEIVPPEPPDDPDDPPVPDCPPTVVVNLNPEGGIAFVIDGCWSGCEPVFEIEFLGEILTVEGNDPVIVPFDLEPGKYPWEVRLVDGCGNTGLDSGVIVVVGPVPPPPGQDDDDLLPPAWGLHKILVCKDGRNKLLPFSAACNLIRKGKATLGACEGTEAVPAEKLGVDVGED
jgi:hypothetical protein